MASCQSSLTQADRRRQPRSRYNAGDRAPSPAAIAVLAVSSPKARREDGFLIVRPKLNVSANELQVKSEFRAAQIRVWIVKIRGWPVWQCSARLTSCICDPVTKGGR
jgi:hypothetical protein